MIDRDKLRQVLNAVFMIGAVITIILYFAVDDKHAFFYVGILSLCIKMAEFIVRFTR